MKKMMIAALIMCSLAAFAQDEGFVARKTILTVDVAVAGQTGAQGEEGNFMVVGWLYPEGTLDEGGGVAEDGSPEFPDLVIGRWICQGWFTPAREAGDGSILGAVTTQSFEMDLETAGGDLIVTYGFELGTFTTSHRAIIGGTGIYRGLSAVQEQDILGLNASGQPNLRSTIVREAVINFKNHVEAQ